MASSTFEHEIIQILRQLPIEKQKQVLDFICFLQNRVQKGVSGQALKPFAGSISIDQIHQIERAIQEGCEQVDART